MSGTISDTAINVLAPLVGRAMATMYVIDATHHLGRTTDELRPGDVPALCDVLRSRIRPFAARPVVDQAMADITARTNFASGR
ncbi:MAG: hypothetical protein U1E29_14060 [Coriobacteriia bacterium]|nr:hypothetical protein [Coriobacteriia bacterium]